MQARERVIVCVWERVKMNKKKVLNVVTGDTIAAQRLSSPLPQPPTTPPI